MVRKFNIKCVVLKGRCFRRIGAGLFLVAGRVNLISKILFQKLEISALRFIA